MRVLLAMIESSRSIVVVTVGQGSPFDRSLEPRYER